MQIFSKIFIVAITLCLLALFATSFGSRESTFENIVLIRFVFGFFSVLGITSCVEQFLPFFKGDK